MKRRVADAEERVHDDGDAGAEGDGRRAEEQRCVFAGVRGEGVREEGRRERERGVRGRIGSR